MKNNSSKNLKQLFIGLVIIFTIFIIFKMGRKMMMDSESYQNPYEYDLTEQKKTPEHLLLYDEIKQIPMIEDTITAIGMGIDNHIYAGGKNRLSVYDASGQLVHHLSVQSPVTCLSVSQMNKIYVGYIDNIQVYDQQLNLRQTWDLSPKNVIITSIVVIESDVYVADAENKLIWRYNLNGDLSGTIKSKYDAAGFIVPSPYFDVAIGYEGYLWAVNPGRHKIENYTPEGSLRSSWGKTSWKIDGFTGCCNPTHITILSDGSFVTSEKGIARVKVFNQTGELQSVVAGAEQFHENTIGLDLARDSEDRIYVADPMKNVVRIFQRKEEK